jgi:hypothetical protein
VDEEICVIVTLESPLLAHRVRSMLPGAWTATVDGADVVVVADDDAHATEIERVIGEAVVAVFTPAEPTPTDPNEDAVGDIGFGIVEAGIRFLDYL